VVNVGSSGPGPSRVRKSPDAFRTIREVSEALDVPQHVLRFWETKFNQVRPLKRGGGRRYYRPEDIELLRRIRSLLYADGYTIRGVQKLMRETSGKMPSPAGVAASAPVLRGEDGTRDETDNRAKAILDELETLRDMLRGRIPT